MESHWSRLVESHPSGTVEFAGTFLVHITTFWLPCAIFTTLDIVAPSSWTRNKIQPISKQPRPNDIRHCFHGALLNQLLTTLLHALQLTAQHSMTNKIPALKHKYRIEGPLPGPIEFLSSIIHPLRPGTRDPLLLRPPRAALATPLPPHPQTPPPVHRAGFVRSRVRASGRAYRAEYPPRDDPACVAARTHPDLLGVFGGQRAAGDVGALRVSDV